MMREIQLNGEKKVEAFFDSRGVDITARVKDRGVAYIETLENAFYPKRDVPSIGTSGQRQEVSGVSGKKIR